MKEFLKNRHSVHICVILSVLQPDSGRSSVTRAVRSHWHAECVSAISFAYQVLTRADPAACNFPVRQKAGQQRLLTSTCDRADLNPPKSQLKSPAGWLANFACDDFLYKPLVFLYGPLPPVMYYSKSSSLPALSSSRWGNALQVCVAGYCLRPSQRRKAYRP